MKNGMVLLVLLGTLSACVSSGNNQNLPVRNGPQAISPYDTSATNPTIYDGGVLN